MITRCEGIEEIRLVDGELTACLARKDYAAATSVHIAAEQSLKSKLDKMEELPNYDEWMKSRK